MNYEEKYLKYKQKYLNLKTEINSKKSNSTKINHLGGTSEVIIPNKNPKRYSFLFMPLLYYTLDNTSVILPDGFESVVDECIRNSKEVFGELPFNNFNEFITCLRFILNSNRINSIVTLEKLKDLDYHIPGDMQEIITNYRTDVCVNAIISCLANMMIERFAGKKFIYTK
jgi:hypothetical protein